MKRRAFFSSIIGGLGASQTQTPAKPLTVPNNVCAFCGTVSPPWNPDPYVLNVSDYYPLSNTTRCKKCNLSFWQDAERVTK